MAIEALRADGPVEAHDTGDRRLGRWGCSLWRRGDWVLALPGGAAAGPDARTELIFDTETEGVPSDVADLILGFTRGAELLPIGPSDLAGDAASLSPELVDARLDEHPTAREVIVAAMSGATRQLVLNLPQVRLDTDPEHLHKARVAVRRLRSDLGTFRPLLDDGWTVPLRNELRWMGGVLGEVRDLDVLVPTLEAVATQHPVMDPDDLRRVLDWFDARRDERRGQMIDALNSARALALIDELIARSRNPPTAPQADDPAEDLLPRLARTPWRRVERAVSRLSADSTDEDLHRVRILSKRARYAAEAVAPASGKRARRFAKAMTDIQDCLGELNDAIIIGAALRHAGAEEPSIAFAAGELAGLLGVRAEHTRKDFRKVWRRASDRSLRTWW